MVFLGLDSARACATSNRMHSRRVPTHYPFQFLLLNLLQVVVENWSMSRRQLLQHKANADALPKVTGAAAVLAGSCSAATLGQITAFRGPHLALDTDAICRGEPVGEKALTWARDKLGNGPILLSASDKPDAVKALQAKYGIEKSSRAIESTMATLAKGLVAAGVGRLVVAGGETSGAVVGALDVTALRIGPEIDPGVPWTASVGTKPLLLALKSGNFGAPDFFTKAFDKS